MDQPVKNETYVVDITDQNTEGAGVGRIGDFVVFVPGAVLGDKARVKIVKVAKTIAYGILDKLEIPSPFRQSPVCPVSGKCGGCRLLSISYEKQLEIKRQRVEDSLRRIGGFSDAEVAPCIPCEPSYRYRNKMVFPVGKNYNTKQIEMGFYAPRSHRIVPVSDCVIGSKLCTPILKALKGYFDENRLKIYEEKTGTGVIRRVFIRNAAKTGEIMVVICAACEDLPKKHALIDLMQQISPNIVSIQLNVNYDKTNTLLSQQNKVIWGKKTITDELCGLTFEISPNSFYQVNAPGAEKLYEKAMEYAALTGDETVWDLYCGIGTITLLAAKYAKSVLGIEVVKKAVENARENAKRNGILNAKFLAGDVGVLAPSLIQSGETPDVIFLDPPRKGCDEKTLLAILETAPKRIVYVSCDPATLSRDLKFICQNGAYHVKKVQPVDLFAHTMHVECVTLIEKKRDE